MHSTQCQIKAFLFFFKVIIMELCWCFFKVFIFVVSCYHTSFNELVILEKKKDFHWMNSWNFKSKKGFFVFLCKRIFWKRIFDDSLPWNFVVGCMRDFEAWNDGWADFWKDSAEVLCFLLWMLRLFKLWDMFLLYWERVGV